MPTPLQQLIPPERDLLFHRMRAAYEGDTETWRRVNLGLRDAIVDYAVRRAPYYRRVVPLGGAFEDIPVLTKTLIREHLPDLMAEGVPEQRKVKQTTSGSTGQSLTFYRDQAQQTAENGSSDRFFRWLHGVPFDATIVSVLGGRHSAEPVQRWRRTAARLKAGLTGNQAPPRDPWLYAFPLLDTRPEDVPTQLAIWGRFRSYFLLGNASGLDWIAGEIERRSLRIPRRPAAIATTSDMLTEQMRVRIERVFGVSVHTRYGSIELPWLAASMPGTTQPYLCNPLLGYVEVVDEDGRPVPPGTMGRILFTDLNNRVMPLIRYEVGDFGVASSRGHIGGFRLIEEIVGRSSELLRFPSGRVIGASPLGSLLYTRNDFGKWIDGFQCVQTGPNEVELRVMWRDAPDESVRTQMARAIHDAADPETQVRVADVTALERLPSGKVWLIRKDPASLHLQRGEL